ncbi:MAG: arginine decarboxylase, pyruvoyl-dependent [Chloroflexi bacterium]|nr:MAG: arginine decarboxylase, pyruvoyl-dependent [Chloroflexota bacterium]HDN79573.1 arginine decarboxylase, pyruvoyl-dependent [Chloroflexota bacterium]
MFQPKYACLVTGASEGETELNAFDNALLEAGIGDINLIKASSIMPPEVEVVQELGTLGKGAFLPVVYTAVSSKQRGDILVAAIGYGRSDDGFGVIMEASDVNRQEEEVRKEVEEKIKFAFARRGIALEEIRVLSKTHKVQECGCVIAACVFY